MVLEATITETGYWVIAALSASADSTGTILKDLTLTYPYYFASWQAFICAMYGYYASESSIICSACLNALVMKPPLHPNESISQSINYWAESGWRVPVLLFKRKCADSMDSDAEIAQSAAQVF